MITVVANEECLVARHCSLVLLALDLESLPRRWTDAGIENLVHFLMRGDGVVAGEGDGTSAVVVEDR